MAVETRSFHQVRSDLAIGAMTVLLYGILAVVFFACLSIPNIYLRHLNRTLATTLLTFGVLIVAMHAVYGGSNTKGNIRVESRTTLEDQDGNDCEFDVGEAYGGGHNAPQDGDAVLEIGCISGMEKAYGGAANADVNGNVVLNITNGTYGTTFSPKDPCTRAQIVTFLYRAFQEIPEA